MHSKIAYIISVREAAPTLYVTTILDADGNEATGVGKDYQVGEEVIVYFHDKYNKCKFHRPKNALTIQP